MKNFFLSLRAEILILKELNAGKKMYDRQIKLADFYDKYENEEYSSKETVLEKLRFIKKHII